MNHIFTTLQSISVANTTTSGPLIGLGNPSALSADSSTRMEVQHRAHGNSQGLLHHVMWSFHGKSQEKKLLRVRTRQRRELGQSVPQAYMKLVGWIIKGRKMQRAHRLKQRARRDSQAVSLRSVIRNDSCQSVHVERAAHRSQVRDSHTTHENDAA